MQPFELVSLFYSHSLARALSLARATTIPQPPHTKPLNVVVADRRGRTGGGSEEGGYRRGRKEGGCVCKQGG